MGLKNFILDQFGLRKYKRSNVKASRNLGIISFQTKNVDKLFRDPNLEVLDAYYENRQFDALPGWDESCDPNGDHVPARMRRPRIMVPVAQTLTGRVASKLFGDEVFPFVKISDFPDEQEFLKIVIRETNLKANLLETGKKLLAIGSCFLRFWLVEGIVKFELWDAKHCYPVFRENGDLETIDYKYVFDDEEDKDENGMPKKKWYKMTLTQTSEILFDNPIFDPNSDLEPEFKEVKRLDHNLGFVQGQWLKTTISDKRVDGPSLYEYVLDFIDELCYSFSQSSQAIGYNQDPQLWFKGIDEEETASLIRSVAKSWNLGKNGETGFIESNLVGVERAADMRDKATQAIQNFTRVVMLDPEKIVGSAQSAKAMEVLHGPLMDLIKELRPVVEPALKEIIAKLALIILIAKERGMEIPIEMTEGWMPKSLSFELKWRSVFQQTLEDLAKKVSLTTQAMTARAISEETGTRFLAEDFGIEDVEAEIAKIKAQPIVNPFGGF